MQTVAAILDAILHCTITAAYGKGCPVSTWKLLLSI